jgi:hypothetical protein
MINWSSIIIRVFDFYLGAPVNFFPRFSLKDVDNFAEHLFTE